MGIECDNSEVVGFDFSVVDFSRDLSISFKRFQIKSALICI
jgi:hypothetical protein